MEYRYKVGEWGVGPPKGKSSFRTIPFTDEAIRILENQRSENKNFKLVPIKWRDMSFFAEKGTG